MKAIAVVSQKGGAGKTTLALHIAVAAELAGLSAAILDMDPQGTAERWGEWRKEEPPAVVAAKTTTLARRLEQARAAEGDLVVIDTPPLAQAEAREAARAADLILIPCRPSAFDLDAIRITATLRTHQETGLQRCERRAATWHCRPQLRLWGTGLPAISASGNPASR